jgi:hypothetical protein
MKDETNLTGILISYYCRGPIGKRETEFMVKIGKKTLTFLIKGDFQPTRNKVKVYYDPKRDKLLRHQAKSCDLLNEDGSRFGIYTFE